MHTKTLRQILAEVSRSPAVLAAKRKLRRAQYKARRAGEHLERVRKDYRNAQARLRRRLAA